MKTKRTVENNVLLTIAIPESKYYEMVDRGTRVQGSLGVDPDGVSNFTVYNRQRIKSPSIEKRLKFGRVSISDHDVRMTFICSRSFSPEVMEWNMTSTTREAARFVGDMMIIDNI